MLPAKERNLKNVTKRHALADRWLWAARGTERAIAVTAAVETMDRPWVAHTPATAAATPVARRHWQRVPVAGGRQTFATSPQTYESPDTQRPHRRDAAA
jgi:septal ring-binding cell division protein DamX